MSERPEIVIQAQQLRVLMEDLLTTVGCPADIASAAAEVHLEADLRGIGLQGIDYMPYMIKYLRSGVMDPNGRPEITKSEKATALIDGHKGLGQAAANLATEVVVKLAKEYGVGAVAVTNSGDIFMLGYYAERIAREGLVGLVFTAGPPLVHPHGGIERMLSTNPLAFGIPTGKAHPLIFDMATSALSSARVRQAAYHGEQVPPYTGIGPDGRPTTDAASIRKGAISPLAGYKGFGLALCIAMLAGPLTGSAVGPALQGLLTGEETDGMGHFLIAIDPAVFQDRNAFLAAVNAHIDEIKNSKRAEGVAEIRIPGERAFAERARRQKEGVPILDATWEVIGKLAAELGIELPTIIHKAV